MTKRHRDDRESDSEPEPDERLVDGEPERPIADTLDEFAPGVVTFPSGRIVEDNSAVPPTDEDRSEEENARDSGGDVADDLLDPRNPHHAQWLKDHGHES